MLSLTAFTAILLLGANLSYPTDIAQVADVIVATKFCVGSAGKDSADMGAVEKYGWEKRPLEKGDFYFSHVDSKAFISFDRDEDGGQRTCTVRASMNNEEVDLLKAGITKIFKATHIPQDGSDIWMFQQAGTRGIQLYKSSDGQQTQVKLIAAEF